MFKYDFPLKYYTKKQTTNFLIFPYYRLEQVEDKTNFFVTRSERDSTNGNEKVSFETMSLGIIFNADFISHCYVWFLDLKYFDTYL